MLGEEVFSKALGVVEKVEGGEVERVGFVFVFLLLWVGLVVVEIFIFPVGRTFFSVA